MGLILVSFQSFQSCICFSKQTPAMLWWNYVFPVLAVANHVRCEFSREIEPHRAAWCWTSNWRELSAEVLPLYGRYEHDHDRVPKLMVLNPFMNHILVRPKGPTKGFDWQHNPRFGIIDSFLPFVGDVRCRSV